MLSQEREGDAGFGYEDSQWPWGEAALCKAVTTVIGKRLRAQATFCKCVLAQEPMANNGPMPPGDAAEIPNASGPGECEVAARI